MPRTKGCHFRKEICNFPRLDCKFWGTFHGIPIITLTSYRGQPLLPACGSPTRDEIYEQEKRLSALYHFYLERGIIAGMPDHETLHHIALIQARIPYILSDQRRLAIPVDK